jgi:hypothetical protein
MTLQRADVVGQVAIRRRDFAEFGVAISGSGAEFAAVAHHFGCQDGIDWRVRPFQRERKARHFGRDVIDALAQQGIFHPLGRPVFLGFALHIGEVAGQPVAFVGRVAELGLQLGLLRLELLGCRRRSDGGSR